VNRQSVVVCRRSASPQPLSEQRTSEQRTSEQRTSEQRTSIAMQIDMTLATSYKPVIMCAVKVCALMVFQYTSIPMLFITERYALIVAFLYVDAWLDREYIVNTNSCIAIIAGSLLVHELRDAGIQERMHGEVAHNIILSILVCSNALLLVFGENLSFIRLMGVSGTTHAQPVLVSSTFDTNNKPRYNQNPGNHLHHSNVVSTGSLVCVLITCALLVLLSTCAIEFSIHDPMLTNLRVWSFVTLSLTWFYTINYRNLRYSTVAPFTPCLLKFSCVLFLTPVPVAIGGISMMGVCLATTYMWICKQQQDIQSHENTHQPTPIIDNVTVVVRESKSHCIPSSLVSYRTPAASADKIEPQQVKSLSSGTVASFVGGSEVSVSNTESASGKPPDVDYDSLFRQAISEQSDMVYEVN
jgi:hypothetical protein